MTDLGQAQIPHPLWILRAGFHSLCDQLQDAIVRIAIRVFMPVLNFLHRTCRSIARRLFRRERIDEW
jgi:hypothetical protein